MQFSVSPAMECILRDMAKRNNLSIGQVLDQAMRDYLKVRAAFKNGKRIFILNGQGVPIKELVL